MFRSVSVALGIVAACQALPAGAFQPSPAPTAARDGQRDFDFETGTWTTEVRVRRNPLTGAAPDWADYRGTSVVRPIMAGRANIVELSVEGPAGRIEGLALRLYNPQSRQWSLNYASFSNGLMTAPVYGRFDARGRGAFYGQDMLDGRAILVRFVITQVSRDEARFEQAYSADGGVTWEMNWIAVDRRVAR